MQQRAIKIRGFAYLTFDYEANHPTNSIPCSATIERNVLINRGSGSWRVPLRTAQASLPCGDLSLVPDGLTAINAAMIVRHSAACSVSVIITVPLALSPLFGASHKRLKQDHTFGSRFRLNFLPRFGLILRIVSSGGGSKFGADACTGLTKSKRTVLVKNGQVNKPSP
jgi:hypothetical protein